MRAWSVGSIGVVADVRACTAAIAAASYRLARITGNPTHIPAAERAYELIAASVNGTGWLQGTVNPQTFNTQTAPDSYSPEGQSFTLMLVAARDAYYKSLQITVP